MKFSIIIPVYNEEKTIKEIIKRIKKVHYPDTYEIIVIDDGSTDNTPQVLKSINDIVSVRNKQNKGKGFSLRKGFKQSKGEIIIIQDADLEYNPKDHLKLISLLKNDFVDVAYGSRFLTKDHQPRYTLFYFGNIFLSFLTKALYLKNVTDMETCYKAFKRKVLKGITLTEDRFGFEPEITCKLLKKGYNILEVPVQYKSRTYKEGKKIGVKDGLRALFVLLKFRLVN